MSGLMMIKQRGSRLGIVRVGLENARNQPDPHIPQNTKRRTIDNTLPSDRWVGFPKIAEP
jgi:hypothetical protein